MMLMDYKEHYHTLEEYQLKINFSLVKTKNIITLENISYGKE